jgi:murein L,D-transpeptidase YcbB/YkuD
MNSAPIAPKWVNNNSRAKTMRRFRMWSVAVAALLAPQIAHSETLAPWNLASTERPAIVEMTAAQSAPSVLDYKKSADSWTQAREEDLAQSISVSRALASTLKEWADAPLSGARADKRQERRLEIVEFYAARGYEPLWRNGAGFSHVADSALAVLQEADQDGLNLAGARPPAPERGWSVDAELALSESIAEYAAQASGERVDPRRVSKLIGMRPVLPERERVLAAIFEAGDKAGEALQNFNPQHDGYRALRKKLAELRAMRLSSSRGDVTRVAKADTFATDATAHSRVSALSNRDPRTIEAEIIANMERWRWLPRDLGADRIEVNIPDFELAVKRRGAVAHRTRVIVGKTTTPTPIFSDRMRFIVVNPSWSVPPSIVQKEMAAKHGGDLSYLAQRGFQVTYRNGRASVRQPPGEGNALGRVKFVFPNDYSVYLHDTPTRNLFSQKRRAFSHGCVRVFEPFKLAEAVLAPTKEWSETRLRRMIGPSERRIDLKEPLPVHIEYFTAFVDENGELQLREDIYGYSSKTRAALKLNGA